MITSLKWVPRGANARVPKRIEMSEQEIENFKQYSDRQIQLAKKGLNLEKEKWNEMGLEDEMLGLKLDEGDVMGDGVDDVEDIEEEEESEEEVIVEQKDKNDLSIYNLDNYDDESTEVTIFGNVDELLKDNEDGENIENLDKLNLEKEDEEDLLIELDDSLLLGGKTEQELSCLEVYLFEEKENNIYTHHDMLLPSFPLSLEWFNFCPKAANDKKGSFVAIGSFESEIEIWDLDFIDAVYPHAVLGKNKKKGKKINDNYHIDAIMALHWNKNHTNLLASSSADTTIKIWDLATCKAMRSFNIHQDKVQAVQWHPIESTILLSGGYDHQVKIFDSRSPQSHHSINLPNEIETVKWDPFNPNQCYISTDNGIVYSYDVRNTANSIFTLHCHDKAVSAMELNPAIPNCLVTGSTDKLIKIWDLKDNKPNMLLKRNFELGQVFSLTFNPDNPNYLAMAGSKGTAKVWDISTNPTLYKRFSQNGYQFKNPIVMEEKMPIAVNDDQESDEED